ncbi:MAG: DUF4118 domain-containing protein [Oscillospiraceae bacterium]|nr:DUF4118 domain-containing protein [Oscillospiraceae bacterium]
MKAEKRTRPLVRFALNILICAMMLLCATAVCMLLRLVFREIDSESVLVFIVAVAVIAHLTDGYFYAIGSAVVSVLLENLLFTYPYYVYNLSIPGYPLSFTAMLVVSLIVSFLTAQIKKQEQVRHEAEREQMRANLMRAVSHDLRTPLSSILGAASALQESGDLPEEEKQELLQEIQKNAQWLVRLTENLLSVTRVSTEGVTLRKSEEVVEEIVGSAIGKFRKISDLPVMVSKPEEILLAPMDATLIEQVILNLLENVQMHAKSATQIWVEIERSGSGVSVRVTDNGKGMSSNVMKDLFSGKPSAGQENSGDGKSRNMGIGLSVCRSIIRAHGGEMNAQNNIFGGATFRFWLPCEQEEV